MMTRVIVRDYNGHYRIDQVDLEDCYKLDELRLENERLRDKVRELKEACENYNRANCKISQELNETRWKLLEAKKQIEQWKENF